MTATTTTERILDILDLLGDSECSAREPVRRLPRPPCFPNPLIVKLADQRLASVPPRGPLSKVSSRGTAH